MLRISTYSSIGLDSFYKLNTKLRQLDVFAVARKYLQDIEISSYSVAHICSVSVI